MISGAMVVRLWHLAQRLPGPVLRGACDVAAWLAWLARAGGVRQLEANLRRVRPGATRRELRRLSLAGMRSYLRYFGEAFALPGMTSAQIDARVRAEGVDELRAAVDADACVVIALGHLGNWDLAGAWATRNIAQVTTVAERLEPEELFDEFMSFRSGMGIEIVPLSSTGGDVFRALIRAVRRGRGLLPLLADRDLTARGVEVELFGERARVAAGPAALHVSTGAPLIAASIHYERLTGERRRAAGSPWGIVIRFLAPIAVPAGLPRAETIRLLTQAWVDELAAAIDAHPADWHMLQKVFVADLDAERYAATLAEAGEAR